MKRFILCVFLIVVLCGCGSMETRLVSPTVMPAEVTDVTPAPDDEQFAVTSVGEDTDEDIIEDELPIIAFESESNDETPEATVSSNTDTKISATSTPAATEAPSEQDDTEMDIPWEELGDIELPLDPL